MNCDHSKPQQELICRTPFDPGLTVHRTFWSSPEFPAVSVSVLNSSVIPRRTENGALELQCQWPGPRMRVPHPPVSLQSGSDGESLQSRPRSRQSSPRLPLVQMGSLRLPSVGIGAAREQVWRNFFSSARLYVDLYVCRHRNERRQPIAHSGAEMCHRRRQVGTPETTLRMSRSERRD